MFYVIGILFIVALVAAFSAVASMAIMRYRPATAPGQRRAFSALAGSALTLSPALMSSIDGGATAVLSVMLGVLILAGIVGYPAVRFFEPKKSPDADG